MSTVVGEEIVPTGPMEEPQRLALEDYRTLQGIAVQLGRIDSEGARHALTEQADALGRGRFTSRASTTVENLGFNVASGTEIRGIAGSAAVDYLANRIEDGSSIRAAATAGDLISYSLLLKENGIAKSRQDGLSVIIGSIEQVQKGAMNSDETSYANSVIARLRLEQAACRAKNIFKIAAIGVATMTMGRWAKNRLVASQT